MLGPAAGGSKVAWIMRAATGTANKGEDNGEERDSLYPIAILMCARSACSPVNAPFNAACADSGHSLRTENLCTAAEMS